MYVIHCTACNSRHLVGHRSMVELANTEIGPVAHFHCPRGHDVLHAFRTRRSLTVAA